MKYLNICVILVLVATVSEAAMLKIIKDTDINSMTQREKYLVILFGKENCTECDELENKLINIEDLLERKIKAPILKCLISKRGIVMLEYFSYRKLPILIFFRNSHPLLYCGNIDEQSLVQHFMENLETNIINLTDENFENITQATNGTGGSWLTFFYAGQMLDNLYLLPVWEAIGAALKNTTKCARYDNSLENKTRISTWLKQKAPLSIVFFHEGKMYIYKGATNNMQLIIDFAKIDYKKCPETEVLVLKSLRKVVWKENVNNTDDDDDDNEERPWLRQFNIYVGASLFIFLLVTMIAKLFTNKEPYDFDETLNDDSSDAGVYFPDSEDNIGLEDQLPEPTPEKEIQPKIHWAKVDASLRGYLLYQLSTLMEKDLILLANLESNEFDKPYVETISDLRNAIKILKEYAIWCRSGNIGERETEIEKKSICCNEFTENGHVILWNVPVSVSAPNWGPALAAGRTVVFNSHIDTMPCTALQFANLALDAGFPQGVVSVKRSSECSGEQYGRDALSRTNSPT